jgi:hypothetical protein
VCRIRCFLIDHPRLQAPDRPCSSVPGGSALALRSDLQEAPNRRMISCAEPGGQLNPENSSELKAKPPRSQWSVNVPPESSSSIPRVSEAQSRPSIFICVLGV